MSNIRVDLSIPIYDGHPVTFRSPADCSQVTGLIVYYPDGETTTSKVFQFADAHGNNVGNLDLFAANVVVKVILDTDTNLAFVQNADTNAYLEARFEELENKASNIVVTEDDDPEDVDFWIDEDDDSTVEDAHINNKENPHKVTLAQVKGCNENLLHNWYFADPIDQRGGYVAILGADIYTVPADPNAFVGNSETYVAVTLISGYEGEWYQGTYGGALRYFHASQVVHGYVGGGYSIDRWKRVYGGEVVTIEDDHILLTLSNNQAIRQYIEFLSKFEGKTVTVSILWEMVEGDYANLYGGTSAGVFATAPKTGTFNKQISSATGTVHNGISSLRVEIAGQGKIKVYAVKLELGSQQTLAHFENGEWVLNEIPDKGEELIKCIQSTADASDTYANKVIATGYTCNKNLLDNWYFGNPVDQREGLVVPPTSINPNVKSYTDIELTKGAYDIPGYRGVTIRGTNSKGVEYVGWETRGIVYYTDATYAVRGYTEVGYTIDKWFLDTPADGAVLTTDKGICLTNRGIYWGFRLNRLKDLSGKKVTASALLSDGKLVSGTLESVVWEWDVPQILFGDSSSITMYLNKIYDDTVDMAQLEITSNAENITVLAAKLELGTEQTLAHQENGKWVLNEIPNKAEEEFRCIHSTADPNDTYANKPIGSIQMDLLWENASPTSAFAAQTISMDLTDYDMVGIIYFGNTQGDHLTNNGEYGMQLFRKDGTLSRRRLNSITNDTQGVYIGRRIFTISESGITFQDTIFSSKTVADGTTNNNEVIPCAIYGIKGVS